MCWVSRVRRSRLLGFASKRTIASKCQRMSCKLLVHVVRARLLDMDTCYGTVWSEFRSKLFSYFLDFYRVFQGKQSNSERNPIIRDSMRISRSALLVYPRAISRERGSARPLTCGTHMLAPRVTHVLVKREACRVSAHTNKIELVPLRTRWVENNAIHLSLEASLRSASVRERSLSYPEISFQDDLRNQWIVVPDKRKAHTAINKSRSVLLGSLDRTWVRRNRLE